MIKKPINILQRKFTSSFDVDAGAVTAIDAGVVRAYGGDPRNNKIVDVSPGRYLVVLHTDNCWNGVVTAAGAVEVPSGELVIGDACYCWDEDHRDGWKQILDVTDFFNKNMEESLSLKTGGDGRFEVDVIISALKELEPEYEVG